MALSMAQTESSAPDLFALRCEADGAVTPIGTRLTIGREDDCGLIIKMGVISRLHAQIFTRSGQLWIEDAGSTNGTFVNGRRISEATLLHPQDLISFDALAYRLVPLAGSAAVDRDRTVIGMRAVTATDAGVALPEITMQTAPRESAAAPRPVKPEMPTVATPLPGSLRAIHAAPAAPAKPSETPDRPAKPEKAGTPPPAGMPASWAESAQLERSSSTMMMSSQLLRELSQPRKGTSGIIAAVRSSTKIEVPNLIGLNHSIAGQLFLLDKRNGQSKWEIGRDQGSDILVVHDSVSGRHAQIIVENGRWKIVNLMSANGSFVNGRKVLSAHLNTGDKIRLGNVELAFDAGGALPKGDSGDGRGGLLSRLMATIRGWFGRG
jgi:pSer/pThr/pTyr-binding forkhead associated (FHA) protein